MCVQDHLLWILCTNYKRDECLAITQIQLLHNIAKVLHPFTYWQAVIFWSSYSISGKVEIFSSDIDSCWINLTQQYVTKIAVSLQVVDIYIISSVL